MSDQPVKDSGRPKRHRLKRVVWVTVIILVVLVLAGPWIVAHTGLRDLLINKILGSPDLTASTKSASFGWFSPLSVDGLKIESKQGHFRAEVEKVNADQPWPKLIASSPELGSITIEKPHIFVQLPPGELGERTKILEPTCTAMVRDAALTVRVEESEPVIDIDGIDVTLHIENDRGTRIARLDPVEIFKKRQLVPRHCSQLLQLMSPAIDRATHVEGSYSLSVDKLRVPLDLPRDQLAKNIEVEGKLALHQIAIDSGGPLLRALVKLVSDVYGKAAPPETVRVVEDGAIQFQVRDGRMHHDGLRFGMPDISPKLVVRSSGSVGFDQSLDLVVEVPRPETARSKGKGPVVCRVTGTLDKPQLAVKDGFLVVPSADIGQPLLDVEGVDLTVGVEGEKDRRVLVVPPAKLLDRQELSTAFNHRLLHLAAPIMEDAVDVKGQISLATDKLSIPLGVPHEQQFKLLQMSGKLQFNEVSVKAKTPLVQALVKLVANVYGTATRPETVRVVEDAPVLFQVRDGRLHHEGLQLSIPDISPQSLVRSSGSVGADGSLDLVLDVARPETARGKGKGPVVCHVTGTLSEPRLTVKDGFLVIPSPDGGPPLLDIEGADLAVTVEGEKDARVLAVAPAKLLDRQEFSEAFNQRLLHLIAPTAEHLVDVKGQVSLSVDKLRIPMGVPPDQAFKRLEMSGTLQLHQVTARAETPLLQAMVVLIAGAYGKPPPPAKVRVVEDASVRFQVRDGRMSYEGLQLGFPDISPKPLVRGSGSVGADGSLDLVLEVARPETARSKGKGPVVCHVTGTLSEPRSTIKDGFLVIPSPDGGPPLLDIEGADLAVTVEGEKDARVLAVAPAKLLDRQEFSEAFNQRLLHLIAPTAEHLVDVKGQVSLSVDKLRIPMGVPPDQAFKRLEMSGTLQLHQISARAETPLLQAIVVLIAGAYGKPAPPATVRVAEDASVRFQARDGRMSYEGLQLGFPDISPKPLVRGSGSVGIDGSLDLVLNVARPETARSKGKGPVVSHVTGTLSEPRATVKDGFLVIPSPDGGPPLLDVDGVDLAVAVEREKDARVLAVAPAKLLDRQDLSTAFNRRLLHLVAPTTEDIVDLKGQVSLSVDKLRMPMGVPPDQAFKRLEMSGKLQLHQISTKVQTPLLQAMVKVLADRFGKKPSEVVRVVNNAEVRFQVREGRLYHEGLQLGFPDISPKLLVQSSGSVGLDKSLDIVLEMPRVLLNPDLRPQVAGDKVRFRITGTVDKPNVVEIK
jgi:hypothetical protein